MPCSSWLTDGKQSQTVSFTWFNTAVGWGQRKVYLPKLSYTDPWSKLFLLGSLARSFAIHLSVNSLMHSPSLSSNGASLSKWLICVRFWIFKFLVLWILHPIHKKIWLYMKSNHNIFFYSVPITCYRYLICWHQFLEQKFKKHNAPWQSLTRSSQQKPNA